MEWLREILIAIVITGVITTWLTGFLNQLVPSPARARLALKNCWGNRPQRAEDGFRVVLCWLGKDNSGHDTETVAQAFVGIDGISLVRSARIVSATGAADEWRRAMNDSARAILDEWNADLAIVGLVKQSDAVLSLWFVPRCSEDTLHRGDQPYTLENVTLGADFHHDLRAQLAAMALTSLAPLADGQVRGQVIDKGLHDATAKLISLVEGRTIAAGGRKAALQLVLGVALCTLGERERSTKRLDQSVDALRAALKEFTRHRAPVLWAATLNSLAMALRALGERESGTERLEEAADAYRVVLEERARERVPDARSSWSRSRASASARSRAAPSAGWPPEARSSPTACAAGTRSTGSSEAIARSAPAPGGRPPAWRPSNGSTRRSATSRARSPGPTASSAPIMPNATSPASPGDTTGATSSTP